MPGIQPDTDAPVMKQMTTNEICLFISSWSSTYRTHGLAKYYDVNMENQYTVSIPFFILKKDEIQNNKFDQNLEEKS